MDKFVVVDYNEGAGGEFIARFISAHFGHSLDFDQQQNPNHTQKWLNSNSIVMPDWDQQYSTYFQEFLEHCRTHHIDKIAVPYHLYKWPHHVEVIKQFVPSARFVKIDSTGYETQIKADFQRKVLDQPVTNFQELQFLLSKRDRDFVNSVLKLYKQGQLMYGDLYPIKTNQPQCLPSNDIKISYKDFFVDSSQTPTAYKNLCEELDLTPNDALLSSLIQRNWKNQQDLEKYLSTS